MNSQKIVDLSNRGLEVLPEVENSTERLCADNNNIKTISSLPVSLNSLSVAHNRITLIANLNSLSPNLETLNVSYNKIASLQGISNCTNLKELIICSNFIPEDEIHLLQRLGSLKTLNISNNNLKSSKFLNTLKKLKNLEELDISHNNFFEWAMDFNLPKLRLLNLDSNKLTLINFTKKSSALEKLSLKHNKLSDFISIHSNTNLKQLDISYNKISQIPESLLKIQCLAILNISNNSISSLPCFYSVEVLDCSKNCLKSMIESSLALKNLNIAHNLLTELPVFYSLVYADFSYNQLKSLSCVSKCYNLEYLNAGYNRFLSPIQILREIQDCKLKIIDLNGLEFNKSNKNTFFKSFPQLQALNNHRIPDRVGIRNDLLDNISNSKLFPSYTSSLTGLDKENQVNYTYNSIFSDIKSSKTALGDRYDTKQELTGRFSIEYQENTKEIQSIPYNPLDNYNILKKKSSDTQNFLKTLQKNIKTNDDSFTSSKNLEGGINSSYFLNSSMKLPKKSTKNPIKKRSKNPCSKLSCKKHPRTASLTYNSNIDKGFNKNYPIIPTYTDKGSSPIMLKDLGSFELSIYTDLDEPKLPQPVQTEPVNLSYLFYYSKVPPRPILSTEKSVPVISKLSKSSNEYKLLVEILKHEGCDVNTVTKTYTHTLHQKIQNQRSISSLKPTQNFILLFHQAPKPNLQIIFNNPRGFEAVYARSSPEKVIFSACLKAYKDFYDYSEVILALMPSSAVKAIEEDVFYGLNMDEIIPVYNIEYCMKR